MPERITCDLEDLLMWPDNRMDGLRWKSDDCGFTDDVDVLHVKIDNLNDL
jgi:hypothetical protein